jgi:YidC/Oxa1 family membrane protein insertase
VYFGTFDAISKFLLKFLTLLQGIVHNWGFALVLLSLGIYFILYPLTLKQLRSMKKMQELQPKIEGLRQLYKNNPQKLNKEVLELYRQEKVNPFGGCLPLILQIPIFFALYQALMRSLELKGETFLWIRDLSEPDQLFILSRPLPLLGNEINLLPLLMMGIMFFQQKFSQTPSVGQAAEQQRLMGIIFPLLFGAIFYHMPAGLVLYWLINSALMTAFQLKTKVKH